MKIRTRITLQFIGIVSLILLIFSVSLYYSFSTTRESDFYRGLKNKSTTTAKLLSDVDEVDYNLLKTIDRNTVTIFPDRNILIFNLEKKLVYNSLEGGNKEVASAILDKIRAEKEIRYKENDKEAIGFLYNGKKEEFIVVASAYDKEGFSKLNSLRNNLFLLFLVSVSITTIFGLIFARQALKPISRVISQVQNITASNLNTRVDTGNGTDEIAQLAIKFNKVLGRLEEAFEIQHSFVANASHELKTPLTVVTGQIEVALMDPNLNKETKETLKSVLDDIKQLNKLSKGLFDLAQANFDLSEIKLELLRIDEIVGAARAELIKRDKNNKLVMNFNEFPHEEEWLTINANEPLLKIAFLNIMDNACKYSGNSTAEISLKFDPKNINIVIEDKGIGISENDFQFIFEPFFRANNAKTYKGHGIGLTLTKKIIQLHKGQIQIESKLDEGTTVKITLPHV